ncbi:diacylglycerol kinase catalytic domain protein [Dictyocaulus viviparus]|uniref:Diacylglycerol kinase catalytic domain protein n=1 Tax=Dictyocaulus viviparus TaxID=29172 RepID=A0A0D8XLB5_DICVI|nr:diacylglycerol kinase catalytic domain protein [Dictyocaulus viviparus]
MLTYSSVEQHSITYRLDELLCVRSTPVKIKNGIPIIEEEATPTETVLFFNFVYKKDKYRWRLKQLPVTFKTMSERNYWMHIITATLIGVRNRPKNIIVFINPFGGKGKAQNIFQDKVEAFFKLTPGLTFQVILTERANHAKDYILEMSSNQWQSIDGLVSVGGDGLFNELLSGALLRTQQDCGTDIDDPDSEHLETPHIRFGIIGAGSANSIVSTVHETTDYATAALHIAIGSECNVDVCTVHEKNHLLRISANAISYGWLGDVLRDSERYRWLGPIRYQWSALRTTIRHPIYRGKVSFSLSRKETEDPNELLPPCLSPCTTCEALTSKTSQITSPYDFHWHNEFTHVICCVIPTVTAFTPYGLAPFTGIGDGTLDLAMVPRISRYRNFQVLRKVAMYGGKGLYQLDRTLCCFRVLRWSFEPDDDQVDPGVWNLDGEILVQPKSTPLHFRQVVDTLMYWRADDISDFRYKKSFCKSNPLGSA